VDLPGVPDASGPDNVILGALTVTGIWRDMRNPAK
jgi:hypothetical protein